MAAVSQHRAHPVVPTYTGGWKCDQPHNLQGPVQNGSAGSFAQKLLDISRWQQQSPKPSRRPFEPTLREQRPSLPTEMVAALQVWQRSWTRWDWMRTWPHHPPSLSFQGILGAKAVATGRRTEPSCLTSLERFPVCHRPIHTYQNREALESEGLDGPQGPSLDFTLRVSLTHLVFIFSVF